MRCGCKYFLSIYVGPKRSVVHVLKKKRNIFISFCVSYNLLSHVCM